MICCQVLRTPVGKGKESRAFVGHRAAVRPPVTASYHTHASADHVVELEQRSGLHHDVIDGWHVPRVGCTEGLSRLLSTSADQLHILWAGRVSDGDGQGKAQLCTAA